jgi:exopolysaccharide biosynthesis polyprenyl glycosylphosphotransferase
MSPMALRLMIVEGVLLFAAVGITTLAWAQPYIVDWLDFFAILGQTVALSVSCVVAFYYNDLYDLDVVQSLGVFATRLVQAFGVAFILLAGFYAFFPATQLAGGPFVSSLALILGLLLPVRAACYLLLRSRPFRERVLILGASLLTDGIIREIAGRPQFRYVVVGVADDPTDATRAPILPVPVLGPLAQLAKITEETKPDRIVVAFEERRGRIPVRQLLEARLAGIVIEEGVPMYERLTGKLAIEVMTPSYLIFSPVFRKTRLQLGLRRLVSLIVAAAGVAVTAPVMALVAASIKMSSPGPIFFVQERIGLAGRSFRLIKFRTMRPRAAGDEASSVWTRDDTGRITPLGAWVRRLRLDELPQFWNILRGDMDLVGPRPEIAGNVAVMSEMIPYYSLRHVVRPGITGWAQIRHGYSVNLEDVSEKIRYDLYYIRHMSLWFDLRILIDTVKIVLFGRGAR